MSDKKKFTYIPRVSDPPFKNGPIQLIQHRSDLSDPNFSCYQKNKYYKDPDVSGANDLKTADLEVILISSGQ